MTWTLGSEIDQEHERRLRAVIDPYVGKKMTPMLRKAMVRAIVAEVRAIAEDEAKLTK